MFTDGRTIGFQIIEEMNFSSRVDCDLVTWANAQAGVIVGTKVHQALAGGRIGLFIDRAWNWKFASNRTRRKVGAISQHCGVDVDGGSFRSRRDIGASGGRDTVLDVGAELARVGFTPA